MKRFDSGTLIPGSTWHSDGETIAEVVRSAVENLKSHQGETEIRPEMVERIKERIVDVDDSAPTTH
jgi:predicted small metal-binding protein